MAFCVTAVRITHNNVKRDSVHSPLAHAAAKHTYVCLALMSGFNANVEVDSVACRHLCARIDQVVGSA